MKYKVVLVKKKNGTFYWKVISCNGKNLLVSQIYKSNPRHAVDNFVANLDHCVRSPDVEEK